MNTQVFECLSGSMSADANTRMSSELAMASLLPKPAIIMLRKYVNERWSPHFNNFKGSAPTPETKSQVRHNLFQGLSDPNSKIRSACAHTLSRIASSDWPDEYPDLLSSLLQLISSSSPNSVHGAMKVFTEFIKSDLSEDQILPILRQLLPVLLSILGSKAYTPVTRSRTITVFQQCVTALYMVKDQHPEAVQEAINSVLPVWLEAFKVLLNQDPLHEINDTNSWDSLHIRLQIFETLDRVRTYFPKSIKSDMDFFLNMALSHLQALYPLFDQYYIKQSAPPPPSAEDESIELPQVACPIIDCITSFIKRGKVRSWLNLENTNRLVSALIGWIQMTTDDEDTWGSDANAFTAQEDDETQTYSLRIAGLDLFSSLMEADPTVAMRAFSGALSHVIHDARQTKETGDPHWWRPLESAFVSLGSVSESVIDFVEDEEAVERPSPIDFKKLLIEVVPPFLSLTEFPFLQGRSFVFASKFGKLLPREVAFTYLKTAVDVIEAPDASIPIKVSAVKAIHNFSLGMDDAMVLPLAPRIAQDIGPFLLLTSEDTLTLVLDTLASIATIDQGSWLTIELASALVQVVLEVWTKNNKDPIFISILSDILASLASAPGPGVYQCVVERSLPTLSTAIGAAKPQESWIASTAIDMVTSLVNGAPEGNLGEGFLTLLAPSLFLCMEQAEDRDVLQNGVLCLTRIVKKDCQQLLAWSDKAGVSGIDHVLAVVAKTLNNESESGGLAIGDLIVHLLRRASSAVVSVLPGLVQAMIRRMLTAKTASFIQSLVMPCAYLVHTERDTMLNLLESMNVDGRSGLDVLIQTWCENAETFQGFWPARVSTLGLCSLLAAERPSLQRMTVKGDLIVKPETKDVIITRSKSKSMPHEFTSVTFPVKALKILVHDLQSSGDVGIPHSKSDMFADSDDGEDEADEWADEDKYAELGTDADKDFQLLSEMLGPKASAFNIDDILNGANEDDDLKDDPIAQIDIKKYLQTFMQECAQRNTNNFSELVDQLGAEEMVVVQHAVQSQ